MHHLVGMAEIAEILGVSRQRVAQLIESYEDFPKPEVELTSGRVWSRTAIETWIASHPERGPGRAEEGYEKKKRRFFGGGPVPFTRFTDLARGSIVKAQEEARLLDHNYIGTEHLLLGLIAVGEGLASEVLSGFDVSLETIRQRVLAVVGRGPETPRGHIPFTPRAKKVLELAFREAIAFKHDYVGTEHVLLGLVREGEGLAWQSLEQLGLTKAGLRGAIEGRIEGLVAQPPTPAPEDACAFCGKNRKDVAKLIAGPGVNICDECVELSSKIIREGLGERREDLAGRLADLERRLRELEER